MAGVLAACVCLLPVVAGTAVLGFFPKPVLGGLLFFLGASFLVENVYDSFFRLPRGEYALVILILAVVVGAGFLQGVGLGIVVSSFLFALNYARINVVRHEVSGASLRSKAARSASDEAALRRDGAQIHVLQLQGYVFFGTAHGLLQRVKDRIAPPGEPVHEGGSAGSADAAGSAPKPPARAEVRFVLLDFRHVHGLDASAVVSFVRMKKLVEAQRVTLVLSELPESVRAQLERGGCLDRGEEGASGAVRVFPDLDHGLEWCEDRIVSAADAGSPASQVQIALRRSVHDEAILSRLLAYFETLETDAGFELYRAGEESNDLYLIESGEAEAWLDVGGGRHRRLRAMGPGAVVGESGLYLGARRSASVRTTMPSTLRRLSGPALERMTAEAPELAAAFHRFVAVMLADRMVSTTSATQMLFH
jgi:SulP family sulfate permease